MIPMLFHDGLALSTDVANNFPVLVMGLFGRQFLNGLIIGNLFWM